MSMESKQHPFTKVGNLQYTRDGDYQKRTFLEWLFRKPRKLKIYNGDCSLQIFQYMCLKKLDFPKVYIPDDKSLFGELISFRRKPRIIGGNGYAGYWDDMNDAAPYANAWKPPVKKPTAEGGE